MKVPIYLYIFRPVVRGVAGVARATPTFDGNRVKSIVVPPQLFGKKRHKAHQILVPPHPKIPTYGPGIDIAFSVVARADTID